MKHIVKSLFFNHDFVLENGFNVHVLIADLTADTDFSYQVDNGLTPIRVGGTKIIPSSGCLGRGDTRRSELFQ